MTRSREVVTVYAIGLFQGLSLVAFPAAAAILTEPSGYGLSSSQYGALFLPQVAMAIVGSLGASSLAARRGLKRVLLLGVSSNVAAMALLVASNAVQTSGIAYPMLLVATACLGAGFGLTLSAISTYAGAFAPSRRDVALTSLNVLLGLGTALSPLLIAFFTAHGEWWYLPLLTAVGLTVLLVVASREPLLVDEAPTRDGRPAALPRLFWVFAGSLVAYGVGETMFGNWGTTLLRQVGVSTTSASYALAAFWASVTVGRLVIALVAVRVRSTLIYVVLPWAIAATLAVTASTTGAHGVLLFALGGLACSGFFPMTVGYGEATFPEQVERATGWLIAAYQVGYGLAAFGGGALQRVVELSTIFRIAAGLAVGMAVLAIVVARRQSSPAEEPGGGATASA